MLESKSRQTDRLSDSPSRVFILAAVLTFAASVTGLRLQDDGIAVFWPAAGVGLGLMLLVSGRQRWSVAAGMLLALTAGNLLQRRSIPAALVFMAGNIAQSWLGAYVLQRLSARAFGLADIRGVLFLVAAAALFPALIGSLVSPALQLVGHSHGALLEIWRLWLASHAIGILAVTPAVLLIGRWRDAAFSTADLVLSTAMGAAALVIVGSLAPETSLAMLLVLVLLVPIVLWVIVGSSPARAALAVLAVAAATIWQTSSRSGLFTDAVPSAQLFLVVFSTALLLLGALSRDRGWLGVLRIRGLGQLQAAMMLIPLLLFIAVAWWSWKVTETEASARVERTTGALAEHAHRILESQQTAVEAALAHAGGRSLESISADRSVHDFLARLTETATIPEVISLVSTSTGRIASDSHAFPSPPDDLSAMDYIARFRQGSRGTYIGRVTRTHFGKVGFTVSRHDPASGLIAVAHPPLEEFIDFYAAMLEGDHDVVSLLRNDGQILVQLPQPESPVGSAWAAGSIAGRYLRGELEAPSVVRFLFDGRNRIVHMRKVGSFPVHVLYGLDFAKVRGAWLRQIAPFAGLSLIGSALILWLGSRASRAEVARRLAELEAEQARLEARTQQSLRQIEERFRHVFENAATGIAITDLRGRFQSCNPAYEALIGYSEEELHRIEFESIIHPDDRPANLTEVRRLLAGERASFEIENRYIHKDGRSIWVRKYVSLLTSDHGRPAQIMVLVTDIGEQRRHQEELQRGREDLNRAQAVAHTGSWRLDVTRDELTWSEENHRIFGVPPGRRMTYETFLEIIHPEDRAYVDRKWTAALAGEPYDIEHRIVVDGEIRWVRERAELEFGTDGALRGGFGTTQDITERRKAEEQLRASEERFRLLVEQADDGIFVAGPDGRYTDVNPAACRMLGYSRDELLALSIADVVSPEEVGRIGPETARFEGGKVARSEWRFRRKDGSIFVGEVVGRQLPDGRLQALVRDITERKQVEDALLATARQAEELATTRLRLASIVDSTSDAIMAFDVDGRITSWNRSAEALFGYTEAEALGRNADLLEAPPGLVPPGESARDASAEALSGRTFRRDTIRVAKDGTIIDVSVTASQLRTPDGRVIGVSAIMRDIRARKRTEDKLRESRQALEAALAIADVAPWGWDEIRRVNLWTDRTKAVLGLPPETEMTRDLLVGLLHPEDVARHDEAWAAALDPLGTHRYQLQYRIRRASDGAERWITSQAEVEFEDDRPVRVVGALRDFTDEKLAVDALKESERRFRQVAESMPQMVWTCRADGPCDYLSPQWLDYTGKPEPEQLGYGWLEQLHPEDRERTITAWREVAAAGRNFSIEFRIRRHDGVYHWFRTLAVPLRDNSGTIVKWFGSNTDIQDIKQAEEALRESEERLRVTNEAAGIGTFIIDVAAGKARYSPGLAEMLGFPQVRETAVELAFARIHREDLPRVRQLYAGAHDPHGDGNLRMEFRFVRPGGEIRWMTWNGKVEFRDTPRGRIPVRVLGACVDTTDRNWAEEKLRASEERLRTIVNTAVDSIIVVDEGGIIESANPATERMFGYSSAELIGTSVARLMPETDRSGQDGFMNAYQDDRDRAVGNGREARAMRRDGTVFQVDLAVVEWFAGGKRYFTGIMRDISDRKRSEEQIRHLLAEVNHRAKNLLGVVQAIALQTVASDPQDFVERFSERIQSLAASQDLLVRSQWQGIELDALVRSQLSHFQDLIGTRITIEGPPLHVSASAAQTIGMALHELATNAGKYGALSVGTGRVAIDWGILRDDSGPPRFTISWTESGGPQVAPPSRRGFGTTVIESMPKLSLEAHVSLRYPPQGVAWTLTCAPGAVLDTIDRGGGAIQG